MRGDRDEQCTRQDPVTIVQIKSQLLQTSIFLFYFFIFIFLLQRVSNPFGWTNPSGPTEKPGRLPYSPSVVVQFRIYNLRVQIVAINQLSYSLEFQTSSSFIVIQRLGWPPKSQKQKMQGSYQLRKRWIDIELFPSMLKYNSTNHNTYYRRKKK